MTILSLQAKQDFLEKDASTRDPIKAIAEFVWNALDADATDVRVILDTNDLGGITAIRIEDNGHGISPDRADHDFGNLGASHKRMESRTQSLERAVHGKEGRGRLKFFSLARRAKWMSVAEVNGERVALSLTIQANDLEKCDRSEVSKTDEPTGTSVELAPLKDTLDVLNGTDAFRQFSTIFAPYILQYPGVRITYNTFEVDPRITIHRTHDIPHGSVI